MNTAIEMMLNRYIIKNNMDRENAIKEILQEIALAGLSRGGFFKQAAFYGGTCLRIFYGLNRFSEDLDFALLRNDPSFNLENYYFSLQKEFLSYGIEMNIESKHKTNDTKVQSAFLKGNTLMLFMTFFPKSDEAKKIISNQKIKIKFEIDTDNQPGGKTEFRYQMLPAPYEIQMFDESSLFAGKIHAVLCRDYKQRVKGRDFYDYLFFITRGASFNLKYLENKLKNSGALEESTELTEEMVKQMLQERFTNVNFKAARDDVSNFVEESYDLQLWSSDLFTAPLRELKGI